MTDEHELVKIRKEKLKKIREQGIDPYALHFRDRKSTRLNSSRTDISRMPSSA